jgi:hypothetical protein
MIGTLEHQIVSLGSQRFVLESLGNIWMALNISAHHEVAEPRPEDI